jgi:hypothetical protein
MASFWNHWAWPIAVVVGSVLLALLVHFVLFWAGKRGSRRAGRIVLSSLVQHAEGPTRWIFPLIAIILILPMLTARSEIVEVLREIAGLGIIGALAWVIMLLGEVLSDVAFDRYRMDSSNNLAARRVRTQIGVLRRIFNIVVIVITGHHANDLSRDPATRN